MIKKLLLPTDGSEHAERTVQYATELAKMSGATIVALYAFNPPVSLRSRGAMMEEFRASLAEEAREIIAEVGERLKAEGLQVTALAVEGPAAEAILRATEDEKPDLIVMGSRGNGGLPGLPLGGVAERVVRMSPVPVLVVK
ncbi:MAG: universal stress protein [Chloroflexi bacterium]|nr:universal stress protein [Chloroflexota bacterium]